MNPPHISRKERTATVDLRSRERLDLQDFVHGAGDAVARRTPDRALHSALAQIGEEVGWPFGHLWIRDPELPDSLISSGHFHLDHPERYDLLREATERLRLRSGETFPGRVLQERRAAWATNIGEEPNFRRMEAARGVGLATAIALPVGVDGEVLAVLEFFTAEVRDPMTTLLDLVQRTGRHFGRIVEDAWAAQKDSDVGSAVRHPEVLEKLRESRKRLHTLSHRLLDVQEVERRRIARGLHDDVGQLLSSIRMNLHLLKEGNGSPERRGEIEESMRMIDMCIRSVRTLALDLRPPHLDELGLVPAVRWYLDRRMRETEVPITLTCETLPQRLPSDIETVLYRVVQEAVTNALRHASAGRIEVSLRGYASGIEVSVVDDGAGFDRSAGGVAGSGLPGMEERVSLLEGRVDVFSTPGVGTKIVAHLPLSEAVTT